MRRKRAGLIALLSVAAVVVAACSSVSIEAPKDVDHKRQWDGAGGK